MIPRLTIVDGATPAAEDLRKFIQEHGAFRTVRHDGHDYAGICPDVPDGIEPIIQQIPGLEDATIQLHFFRRNTMQDPVTSWIHADGGIADTAIVWYLSPDEQCAGGTAFFRFKPFGWEEMPSKRQMDEVNLTVDETAALLQAAAHEETDWERTMIVPARFNRMIVYPSKSFHGRYPKEGFGEDAETARLIYVAFLTR